MCILDRKVACTEGEVRLLGGPDEFSGVLTVCVNGALTLVCARSFDIREANVICRQAGFVNRGIYLATFLTDALVYLLTHSLSLSSLSHTLSFFLSLSLSSWFNTIWRYL